MAGHNKWTQIKRKKGASDAKKSQLFGKLAKLIAVELKKANGNTEAASLKTVIERARAANMPKENIERAISKGMSGKENLESIIYEAYGPGGTALMIETLTDSRNRSSQEVKHALAENGGNLAAIGGASWAFEKRDGVFVPLNTVPLSDEDVEKLDTLVEALEALEDVQEVFTNAE